MRVYIAGPVTGRENDNREAFHIAAADLSARGFIPVLPHQFVRPREGWEQIMRNLLPIMLACDAVYALRDWEKSQGARLEVYVAQNVGMTVSYQYDIGGE
jgi:nucleoside 2-deoxyribosyltransferase